MRTLVTCVCYANIHRSVLLELFLRRTLATCRLPLEVEVASRGLQGMGGNPAPRFLNLLYYPQEFELTKAALQGTGVEWPVSKIATPIDEEIVRRSDLLLIADRKVLHSQPSSSIVSLTELFPAYTAKMHLASELAGRTEDLPDCFQSADLKRYQTVVSWIQDLVSEKHMHRLLQFLTSSGEEK